MTWASRFGRFLACCSALLLMPGLAHAYLDPGTGSLLFQSLLAVLFGVSVAWRRLREFVASCFRKLFTPKRSNDQG
jgi:hypothetical protein